MKHFPLHKKKANEDPTKNHKYLKQVLFNFMSQCNSGSDRVWAFLIRPHLFKRLSNGQTCARPTH